MPSVDAVVVGAGINGLVAALTLAEAGHSVHVVEASDRPGGGCRTAQLTLPGFVHDVCSTVHAMSPVSPALRGFDLPLCRPPIAFAQPLGGGRAAVVHQDVARTADGLGGDGRAWQRLMAPLTQHADALFADLLGDLRHLPRHPLLLARFGLPGLLPVTTLARTLFRGDAARALLAGAGAHAMQRLSAPLTGAFGLVLAISAHATGWPVLEGGSERLTDALVARLRALGVNIECGHRVSSLAELPAARAVLLDLTPRQLLTIAGEALPPRYRRALQRFRYGPGVFKIDYALSGPVPWTNADCRDAGTLHVGGTLEEMAASEAEVAAGRHPDRPYVLTVQASVADPSRAPAGAHALWAYTHVPSGSTLDRTQAIEAQFERFAPGFRDLVLARATRNAVEYEAYDGNFVGGDINGGRAGLFQTVLGPVPQWSRYRTPLPGVYLCSSSTPPGGGIHGMCGYNAAHEVLRQELRS